MNYAETQDPRKNLIGITAVVAFHAILVYALINGLANKVVKVLQAPLDVSVIEEIKKAPPPPPPKVVPPKVTPPPQPFVPPPEVAVPAQPQEPVIAAVAPTPPPPPVAATPIAPPVINVAVACPNSDAVRSQVPYPPQAERMALSGSVLVEFTVGPDGAVKNVNALRSSNALFTEAATQAVAKFRCNGQGHDVRVRVPFAFRLD